MRLKEHLYNIAWIFIAHVIGMLLVTHAVLPLQSLAVPNIGTFAALIFPIHGIRVIAAWMFGWWSVPYLFAANVLLALFYAVIAMETPYLEFTAERLMSWSLVSGVCQRCCPPISCGVSDLRDADFIFRVEPDGSGGLPVSDFA
jgi:hypothetical protein